MEFQSEFVGRKREVDSLMRHLDEGASGRGRLIFVTGEAGVGKTRLVQELIVRAGEKGYQSLSGRCLYQEGSDPYLPFIDPLKRFLAGSDEENEDVQYRIPMGLTAMSFNGGDRSSRESMPMGLIGIGGGDDEDEDENGAQEVSGRTSLTDIDFTKERDKMFSTVSYLIRDLSMDRPILFFLDDLHWADSATLQLLTYIARNIRDVKVILICAFRTEELEMGSSRHPLKETLRIMSREHLYDEVKLTRLGADEVKVMIRSLLEGSEPPGKLVDAVQKETEGNPYFVEEVVKSLVSEGVIDPKDPGWARGFDTSQVKIPSTVNDLMQARIERLEPKTKKVLEVASVIGDVYTLDVLSGVAGMMEEELVDHLDDLMEAKMVREEAGALIERYRFTHKLIREVTYNRLSRAKKRLLHKKVGETIEGLSEKALDKDIYALAFHFSHGNVVDKAVRYSMLAGDKASAAFAAEDAIGYYNTSIEFLERQTPSRENEERRISVLTKIGDLHYMTGEWDRAVDYYYLLERRAKKIDNMKMVCLATRKMGQIERLRGNWDTASRYYETALDLAKRYGDDLGRADSERGLGYIHWRKGEFDDAIKHFEDSLEISKNVGDRFITGRTYIELGNVLAERGILDGAEFHYNTAIEILEAINDYMELSRAYNNLGDVYMKKEEWERAIEYLDKACELANKLGDPHMLSWALFNIAECFSKSGRLDQAFEKLEQSKAILLESDDAVGQAYLFIEYGIYHRFKKEWEDSIVNFKEGQKLIDELHIPSVAAYGFIEIANMFKDKGDKEDALNYFKEALKIYERLSAPMYIDKVKRTIKELER